MSGQTPKGESTRQEILRVSAEVFARHGYAGTRMEDIIRASGLTKGAIYFHFRSKEDLAREVVADHKRQWLSRGQREVARHEDPVVQLRKLGELLLDLTARDDSSWNVVRLADQIRTESATKAEDGPLAGWVTQVAEIIARGQDRGRFSSSFSAADAGVIVVAAFDGLKTASDALAPGDADVFARRARLLLTSIEAALIA